MALPTSCSPAEAPDNEIYSRVLQATRAPLARLTPVILCDCERVVGWLVTLPSGRWGHYETRWACVYPR